MIYLMPNAFIVQLY